MTNKILAFNWKMNPASRAEAENIFSSYEESLQEHPDQSIIVCTPDIYLTDLIYRVNKYNLHCSFGSQDIVPNPWFIKNGAFTGETSGAMYANLGCKYALVGHSERREYCKLNDHDIQHRVESALQSNLTPILCIGFAPKQEDGVEAPLIDYPTLTTQIKIGLQPYQNLDQITNFPMIAYEPVWAIGTGLVPTNEQIIEVSKFIRGVLADTFGSDFAHKCSVLYGGSVNDKNIEGLSQITEVDGFLIGGAGIDPEKVRKMLK